MDSFSRREEGFERAFTHQEDLRFQARARRNRKLGFWAAQTLGLAGEAQAAYAGALVARGLEADDEALVLDLAKALQPHDISDHRVRRRLEAFEAEALAEIQAGR